MRKSFGCPSIRAYRSEPVGVLFPIFSRCSVVSPATLNATLEIAPGPAELRSRTWGCPRATSASRAISRLRHERTHRSGVGRRTVIGATTCHVVPVFLESRDSPSPSGASNFSILPGLDREDLVFPSRRIGQVALRFDEVDVGAQSEGEHQERQVKSERYAYL